MPEMSDKAVDTESSLSAPDHAFLLRAIELAESGRGRVSPNPVVGAVIVREETVLGEGFHAVYGSDHAEVAAIKACGGADLAGATIYVSLEPCAHQGKTPPCSEAVIAAGIKRVVIASTDPSTKAAGKGPKQLEDAGVDVIFAGGELERAAIAQNQAFRKHQNTGKPLVTYKSALTLDGRVATQSGDSKWISGKQSRELVHQWRGESDAVAVGIGTALADDPMLNTRGAGTEAFTQPRRILFDWRGQIPTSANAFKVPNAGALTLFCADDLRAERVEELRQAGADVFPIAGEAVADRVDAALTVLGGLQVTSLLLEGGPSLAGQFFDSGEIDQLRFFIAPVVLGQAGARAPIEGRGSETIEQAVRTSHLRAEQIGEDVLLHATVREW